MAYARLEILADSVRGDLERHFAGRPAQIARHLRWLLEMLLTAEVPDELDQLAAGGEVRGLRTHLDVLRRFLQTASHLPEALCCRYKYGASERRSRARYGVGGRSWRYVHDLAAETGVRLEELASRIAYERQPWHDALEEHYVHVEALLDMRALESMLLAALEAYLSPRPSRRKGYEVYGINLGMTRHVRHTRPHEGRRETRYVYVMRSQTQLSAVGAYDYVEPNPRSLNAILEASRSLFPQYQAVGDFHSHPCDDLPSLEARQGWTYTSADEGSNVEFAHAMAQLGQHVQVCLVIAVTRSGRKVALSHFKGMKNTLQMSVGNCRGVIAAYRSLESGRLTFANIRLRLSGMAG